MSNQSDNLSLAHTCWNCKYHVVFAPKYRRKEFYGLKRLEIGQILRKLCEWKGIPIHEDIPFRSLENNSRTIRDNFCTNLIQRWKGIKILPLFEERL